MKKITISSDAKKYLTDEYITWLENFSKRHPVFSIQELLKNPKDLSPDDISNLRNFKYFHKAIAEYAFYNFFDFSKLAKIKYKDFYFSFIGFDSNKNDYFFTINEKKEENYDLEYRYGWFLDYKLIQKEECIPETEEIDKEFENIADAIREFQIKHNLDFDVLDGHMQYLFTSIFS